VEGESSQTSEKDARVGGECSGKSGEGRRPGRKRRVLDGVSKAAISSYGVDVLDGACNGDGKRKGRWTGGS